MPFLKKVISSWFIVHRSTKTTNYQLPTINWRQKRHGFTLIELLVAITISTLVVGLITASYVSFSNSQKLKTAVAGLKSDLRLVQNKATSGDKGVGHNCGTNVVDQTNLPSLVGWYLRIDKSAGNNVSYTISGDCIRKLASDDQVQFGSKTVNLPPGVTIFNFSCPSIPVNAIQANILYRPSAQNPSFHYGAAVNTPPFLNSDGTLHGLLGCGAGNFTITLSLSASLGGATRDVAINTSGEIHDQ